MALLDVYKRQDYMWLISHTAFTSGLYVTPPIELPDVETLFNITVDGKGDIYQNARINAVSYTHLTHSLAKQL